MLWVVCLMVLGCKSLLVGWFECFVVPISVDGLVLAICCLFCVAV